MKTTTMCSPVLTVTMAKVWSVRILTFAAVFTCSLDGRAFALPLEPVEPIRKNESEVVAAAAPVPTKENSELSFAPSSRVLPGLAVDHTLAIVAPIAAGIFLIVVVFFLYIISEGNVAEESMDYETLDNPPDEGNEDEDDQDDEDMLPTTSTSGSVTQAQVNIEPNPSSA